MLEHSVFDRVLFSGGFQTARFNCSAGYVGDVDFHTYFKCENFFRDREGYEFHDCTGDGRRNWNKYMYNVLVYVKYNAFVSEPNGLLLRLEYSSSASCHLSYEDPTSDLYNDLRNSIEKKVKKSSKIRIVLSQNDWHPVPCFRCKVSSLEL